MVIEAAGCLHTYEKTAAGHECTTLVMDKYTAVPTHTAQIQTEIFPSILDRPHAAPVVRGVWFLDLSAQSNAKLSKMSTSVGKEAESFWKVMTWNGGVVFFLYFFQK
jgi:hypothetical protein